MFIGALHNFLFLKFVAHTEIMAFIGSRCLSPGGWHQQPPYNPKPYPPSSLASHQRPLIFPEVVLIFPDPYGMGQPTPARGQGGENVKTVIF